MLRGCQSLVQERDWKAAVDVSSMPCDSDEAARVESLRVRLHVHNSNVHPGSERVLDGSREGKELVLRRSQRAGYFNVDMGAMGKLEVGSVASRLCENGLMST